MSMQFFVEKKTIRERVVSLFVEDEFGFKAAIIKLVYVLNNPKITIIIFYSFFQL